MSDRTPTAASGPLAGVRVLEFAGLGPGPFACMLMSDMGADVVRVERHDAPPASTSDIVGRGRRTLRLDLKQAAAKAAVLDLLERADVLVEGFRPGVMERLGLGPQEAERRNPRLVYGRITGWGQEGPLAQAAGHDLNYIALTGALAAFGEHGRAPVPPLNLVGDYGAGALYLVCGVLAAVLHARATGQGQVVDAAICDGVLSLMSNNQSHRLRGAYRDERGSNMLDGGAPYYTTYATADGRYLSLGPIEPKFFALLCDKLGLAAELAGAQHDRTRWEALRDAIARVIGSQSLAHWNETLQGTDACYAPVLTLAEAAAHPHVIARRGFVEFDGVTYTAPAPRFSRTPSAIRSGPSEVPITHEALLADWHRSVMPDGCKVDDA